MNAGPGGGSFRTARGAIPATAKVGVETAGAAGDTARNFYSV